MRNTAPTPVSTLHPGGPRRQKHARRRRPPSLRLHRPDNNRIPRLEYIEADAPRAWPALAATGFTIERRTPVMTAAPGWAGQCSGESAGSLGALSGNRFV
jgi:hypothetical protein